MTKLGEVKLQALDLHVDESKLTYCPFCNAEHERSFSMTRKADGIVYHCFRASCGASGFVSSTANYFTQKETSEKKTKPYTGSVVYYDHYHYPFLADRFDIDPVYMDEIGIVDEEQHHYLLPVYGPNDKRQIGKQLRRFDGSKPKAILYYDKEGPYIQIAPAHLVFKARKPTVFIVEDYFSCLKVQEALDRQMLPGMAVSILGTHVSDDVALWLSKNFKSVVMMLDPDAVNKAQQFVSKYQLIWPGARVVVLDDDPKDTPMDVLKEIVLNLT